MATAVVMATAARLIVGWSVSSSDGKMAALPPSTLWRFYQQPADLRSVQTSRIESGPQAPPPPHLPGAAGVVTAGNSKRISWSRRLSCCGSSRKTRWRKQKEPKHRGADPNTAVRTSRVLCLSAGGRRDGAQTWTPPRPSRWPRWPSRTCSATWRRRTWRLWGSTWTASRRWTDAATYVHRPARPPRRRPDLFLFIICDWWG